MLGDRYGYQPLPSSIPADEFALIYQEAQQQDHPKFALLSRWYKRDDNAVPAEYVLQVIVDTFDTNNWATVFSVFIFNK